MTETDERPALRVVPDHGSDTAATLGADAEEASTSTAVAVSEPDDREENRAAPVPVDPPSGEAAAPRTGEHTWHPVLPDWMRTRADVAAYVRWAGRRARHRSAYHAVRCPAYAGRLAARSPRGAARVMGAGMRWLTDAEGQPVRDAAVRRGDSKEYMRLVDRRNARVRLRLLIAAGVAALALALTAALVAVTPAALGIVAVGAVVALGLAGRPADAPQLAGRAVVAHEAPKLTSDAVVRALAALGIGEINKALTKGGTGITFPNPITRDGAGWRAEVDLPHGVTASDIMERRDRLASGLRRPLGCVWPEPVSDEHTGRLVLWVGDQDMNQARQPAWPLARSGQADIFALVPFGADQRGRPVRLELMFNSAVIGAMPRMGKTFALRVLALAAALDPRVQLRAFQLKGTGDLSALEKVAHHYGNGLDDETIEACLRSLQEIEKEMERRSKVISKLPKTACPESKVTPQLAARQDLGLFPIAFIVDECQELFTHPDFKDEAERVATRIVKLGPAMGIMLILATQRPDAKSLPKGISANAGIRFCLRVMGQEENDMVLGTSAYKNGLRATTFTARDKGIGYLVGVADDPIIARASYIDGTKADVVTDRARAMRETAGTLSGHAIGHDTLTGETTDTLLEDVLAVIGPDATGEERWGETIAARLAGHRPETYGSWGAEQLTAALKPHGIKTGQVWGTTETGQGANRRGVDPSHITAALTKRDQHQKGDSAARSSEAPR